MRYRIVNLSNVLLYLLYDNYISKDDGQALDITQIADLLETKISKNLLNSAMNLLRREPRYVMRSGNAEKGYTYSITELGIIWVERDLRRQNSIISFFAEHGESVLDEVAGIHSDFVSESEREKTEDWRPLPIDRQSEDFVAAVSDLESTISTIETDNGFAANYPEQRAGILASLKEGLRWLKELSPSRQFLFSTIVSPLRWISVTFGNSVLGETAKEAAKQFVAYIMSLH